MSDITTKSSAATTARPDLIQRLLDRVERAGNRLPQPVTLFAILIGIVLISSWIASMFGVSAIHPREMMNPVQGADPERIYAVNLLNAEGIRRIFTEMVTVFTGFPPLGMVLVVMLGIGVAERSGLIGAALRAFVAVVPRRTVTFAIVTAGMLSSVAADAGYVVLVPLGAVIFHSMGRHPIAGLAAAFAGVSGGFGANIFLTSLDPLLAGFTEPAARLIDPAYVVNPTANWYLMAASVPILALAGTFVTERILEPRLGEYHPENAEGVADGDQRATPAEKKGLLVAAGIALAFLVLVLVATISPTPIFRGEDGDLTPLFVSIVPLMLFIFFLPGLAYGIITGTIRSDRHVASMTSQAMGGMGGYIVLAFVAAQFVAFFNWSNLGVIVAISGAQGLQAVGFSGIPLIVSFIIVSSGINLVIGSASAKWAIMAPIFVPMLMLMGYSPELTQAAYRIGDSYSNILTPLLPYFPLIIISAQRYQKKLGIGTIISAMLPFAVAFMLVRIPMMIVWMMMNLPLGPGAPLVYPPVAG